MVAEWIPPGAFWFPVAGPSVSTMLFGLFRLN
jgi:hypothetical protein